MANKIYPKTGDLAAYHDENAIQFIIAVANTCRERDEFGGVVIFANRLDASNPCVGNTDNNWWVGDAHFRIMDPVMVSQLFGRL